MFHPRELPMVRWVSPLYVSSLREWLSANGLLNPARFGPSVWNPSESHLLLTEMTDESKTQIQLAPAALPESAAAKWRLMRDPTSPYYSPIHTESNYTARTPWLNDSPILRDLMERLGDRVTRVRILRLQPKSEAVSPGTVWDTAAHYHIPIFSNSKCCVRYVNRHACYTRHLPEDSGMWFVNYGVPYQWVNDGEEPAFHLEFRTEDQSFLRNTDGLKFKELL